MNGSEILMQMDQDTIPRPWKTNGRGLLPPDNIPAGFATENPLVYICMLRNLAPELIQLWAAAENIKEDLMYSSNGRVKVFTDMLEELNTAANNMFGGTHAEEGS